MPEVHFCQKNLSKGTDKLIERLKKEHPDIPVRVESCLDFCSDCALKPIAISNEYFMRADDINTLYEQIEEEIKDSLAARQ
jgi:uncharacterized protein YuzB (UPF0349 family)